MTKRHPLTSVVVPLYNGAEWIVACLSSVLEQTLSDLEVVVVDDGSTDNGPDLVASIVDERIRLVRQANRGLAGARNTGIRASRGRFIAFLDADDLWHPDKLSRHVLHLMSSPELGVSFSHSLMIDEEGQSMGLHQRPPDLRVSSEMIFCRNPIGNGSAPVLRREVLDAVCFAHPDRGDACWFDEAFRQSEDIELWTRIALLTRWGFAAVPLSLTSYRIRTGALSSNIEAQLSTWRRFRAKVACYAPDFARRVGRRAEAYQLRYLARRAIQTGHQSLASRLIVSALSSYPAMLREEPTRTFVTLLAAFTPPACTRLAHMMIRSSLLNAPVRLANLRF